MLMFCRKPLYLGAANARVKTLPDHAEEFEATLALLYLRLLTATSTDYEVIAGIQSVHTVRHAKRKDTSRPEYRAAVSASTLVNTIRDSAKSIQKSSWTMR